MARPIRLAVLSEEVSQAHPRAPKETHSSYGVRLLAEERHLFYPWLYTVLGAAGVTIAMLTWRTNTYGPAVQLGLSALWRALR